MTDTNDGRNENARMQRYGRAKSRAGAPSSRKEVMNDERQHALKAPIHVERTFEDYAQHSIWVEQNQRRSQ